MKLINSVIDRYFAYSLICDTFMVAAIWLINLYFSVFNITLTDKSTQLGILSNLIGTNISLAGFILAALTIIVTFKSNIKIKGLKEAQNALELIFSSKHYDNIVAVFKKAIIELVVCSLILYILWVYSDNLNIITINRANVSGIFVTAVTILRSLYILFAALGLEKYRRH